MQDKTGLVARTLRRRIGEGTYPSDTALPSVRELMAEFQASRTTIRRAIGVLTQAGLVQSHAGIDPPAELIRVLDLPSEEAGACGVAQLIAAKVPFTAAVARLPHRLAMTQ
jgi:DNA-binding transcriptional MocR family regulator